MVDSVFKTRSLSSIYDEINNVYQADDRPWILGFSGGKDSTCMVQLIWHALSKLPKSALQKKGICSYHQTLLLNPQRL